MSNPISRLFRHRQGRDKDASLSEMFQDLKKRFNSWKEKSARSIKSFAALERDSARLSAEMESLKVLCGRLATESLAGRPPGTPFAEVEFQVFSQWGEDGILQHLLRYLRIARREFVEFGVENYTEASTRFLLLKDNWRGLIMDGSEENIVQVRNSDLYWRHDLTARCAFITPDNINGLLSEAGFTGDIGILSVDVDGMDYWIWRAVTEARPAIVISEYNSVFGPHARVTIPPDNAFQRSRAHPSNVFYGASLAALEHLASEKGYDLAGVNSAGNNAFFIHRDIGSPFPPRRAADVFVEARFREARDEEGKLTFASATERRGLIADCDVFDVSSGAVRSLRKVWLESDKTGA